VTECPSHLPQVHSIFKGLAADATGAPQPWVLLCNPVTKISFFFSFFQVPEHRWNEIDRGKPKYSGGGGEPVPVPLCPPQIPHELTWDRTRASAVRGRRLTAWAMARPTLTLLHSATEVLSSVSITAILTSRALESTHAATCFVCQLGVIFFSTFTKNKRLLVSEQRRFVLLFGSRCPRSVRASPPAWGIYSALCYLRPDVLVIPINRINKKEFLTDGKPCERSYRTKKQCRASLHFVYQPSVRTCIISTVNSSSESSSKQFTHTANVSNWILQDFSRKTEDLFRWTPFSLLWTPQFRHRYLTFYVMSKSIKLTFSLTVISLLLSNL
jgi:hypothetical protein